MTKLLLPRLMALSLGLAACSVPPSDARIGVNGPSENASEWYPVADYMGYHCGTLDCHGNAQRNYVIWSCFGLRLGDAIAGCPRGPMHPDTTPEEYSATYRSLVGLEPAVMSVVVAGGGTNPDLLTFIRKARGEENHKGGTVFTAGSSADVCITSWLSGATNITDCSDALLDIDSGAAP